MNKQAKSPYAPTFHRDGTVTVWDVYSQTWERSRRITDRVLASMPAADRERVIKHTSKR